MSTRGTIARTTGEEGGFIGIYHHWDSYPTALGSELWRLYHGHFHGDLSLMLKVLIDQHSAGWSTIVGKDFNLKPGYGDSTKGYPSGATDFKTAYERYRKLPHIARPQCYCHGARHEKTEQWITHKTVEGDIEWIYAFDEAEHKLFVVDHRHHTDAAIIDLRGDEPDWLKVECGEELERCSHVAEHHFPQLRGTRAGRIGTLAYIGLRPLGFHAAVAFLIRGKRYEATGSGRNGAVLWGAGKTYGRNVWVASVKASGADTTIEMPVAVIDGENGYSPYPGVTWVFPPTRDNPEETLRAG